jgi:hypothetical protein
MDVYAPEIERMMRRLFDSLKESDRRRYAAIEAAKLGHGGIEYIARVLLTFRKSWWQFPANFCDRLTRGATAWSRGSRGAVDPSTRQALASSHRAPDASTPRRRVGPMAVTAAGSRF